MNYALDIYAMYAANEGTGQGMLPIHVYPFTDWTQLEPGVVTMVPNRVEINLYIAEIVSYLTAHPKVYFMHDVATFDDSFPYVAGVHNIFSHELASVSLPVGLSDATMHVKVDQWAKSDDCVYVVREVAYSPACVNIHAMCLGHWANVNGAVRNRFLDDYLTEE